MYLRSMAIIAALLISGCSQGRATEEPSASSAKPEIPIKGEGIGDACRVANVLNGDLSIERIPLGYLIREVGYGMREDIRYPVLRAVLVPQKTGYFYAEDPWGETAFDVENTVITPRQQNCGSWATERIAGDGEGRWSIKRDGRQVATIYGDWPPKF